MGDQVGGNTGGQAQQGSRRRRINALITDRGEDAVADAFNYGWGHRSGVDISRLPDDLAGRCLTRQRKVKNRGRGNPESFTVISGFVGVVAGFVSAMIFADEVVVGFPIGFLAWGLTYGVLVFNQETTLQPRWLTLRDRRLFHAAAFRWPAGEVALGRYPNHEKLVREWQKAAGRTGRDKGVAPFAWREPRLVGLADLLASEIRSSLVWKSELFDVHRARIDLVTALHDINARAYRVWLARANSIDNPAYGRDSACPSILDEAATIARRALVDRVLILADYRAELETVEKMLKELDAVSSVPLHDPEPLVRQLLVDAAINELETRDLEARVREVVDVRAELADRLDYLRAQIVSADYLLTAS